jgi:hypothetical protein
MDSEPRHSLLVIALAVAGVLILVWLIAVVVLAVFAGHHTVGGYTPR